MYAFFHFLGEAVLFGRLKNFQYFFAPIAGYALYAYLFFFLFHLTTHPLAVIGVTCFLATGSIFLFFKRKKFPSITYFLSVLLAAVFSIYVAYVLSPVEVNGHLYIEAPLFDHMKTAITASIVNNGIPVINPFAAFPFKLHYYFLSFVPSASIKILFGISAYEAEIVSTMLTALIGLVTIFGTVCILKGKEISPKEIFLGGLLLCTATVGTHWSFMTGVHGFDTYLRTLFWTPHTIIATSCLVLVLVLIYQTGYRLRWLLALLLAVTAGISIYIAIVAALGIGLFILMDIAQNTSKKKTLQQWLPVILLSALLALPFLFNQAGVSSEKFPVAFSIYHWTLLKNPFVQIVGFLTIYYFSQAPALYIINLVSLRTWALKKYAVFYLVIFSSMFVTCFFRTTIDNNDLGWRAIFVSIFLLIIFSVYWINQTKNKRLKILFILLVLTSCDLPFTALERNHLERKRTKELSPQSIRAIQQHVSTSDYFLNNVHKYFYLPDGKHWDGNLEFMIMTERKSCYSSLVGIRAYANKKLSPFAAYIGTIFSGTPTSQDILEARRIFCSKFIFHYTDPNFEKEEMLQKAGLEKIYQNEQIKIYQLSSSI